MRFATYAQGGRPALAGVVSDAGVHPLPDDVTVLGLVRAGLPAALILGGGPPGHGARPAWIPAGHLIGACGGGCARGQAVGPAGLNVDLPGQPVAALRVGQGLAQAGGGCAVPQVPPAARGGPRVHEDGAA